MKKIILFFLLSIILSSCSSGTTSTTDQTNTTTYEGSGFTMDTPKSWVQVNKEKELPPVKTGTIELATSSIDITNGFANNLVILSQKLNQKTTSKEYADINYSLTTKDYTEYTKLDMKEVTFSDDDKSNLYIFEAKYNTTTPKIKFLQTAKVCLDNTVYLITIGIGLDKQTDIYENLIKSFTCKKN